MLNPIAVLLGVAAYLLLGGAYCSWRAQAANKDLSPMGILRDVEDNADKYPDLSALPVPVIAALVAIAWVCCFLLAWPVLLLRRMAMAARTRGGKQ